MELNEPVTMAFASRYIGLISKATPLSGTVTVSIKDDQPLLVEYKIGDIGHLRYFLAPKTDQGEVDEWRKNNNKKKTLTINHVRKNPAIVNLCSYNDTILLIINFYSMFLLSLLVFFFGGAMSLRHFSTPISVQQGN